MAVRMEINVSALTRALSETMPRARIAADSFYFLMTDRYANGDPSNDGGSADVAAGLAQQGRARGEQRRGVRVAQHDVPVHPVLRRDDVR